MGANDRQVGGDHYQKEGDFQHWDMVQKFDLDYFQGQITRYLFRWRDKGGVQDLEKARHFLDKYIELASKQAEAAQVDLKHALDHPTGKWTIGQKDGRLVANFVGEKSEGEGIPRRKVRPARKK